MFCMHGGALAEPFAGGLLVVAHPQIKRVARSAPAARVRFIMRIPPTTLKKPPSYLAFTGISQDVTKGGPRGQLTRRASSLSACKPFDLKTREPSTTGLADVGNILKMDRPTPVLLSPITNSLARLLALHPLGLYGATCFLLVHWPPSLGT